MEGHEHHCGIKPLVVPVESHSAAMRKTRRPLARTKMRKPGAQDAPTLRRAPRAPPQPTGRAAAGARQEHHLLQWLTYTKSTAPAHWPGGGRRAARAPLLQWLTHTKSTAPAHRQGGWYVYVYMKNRHTD